MRALLTLHAALACALALAGCAGALAQRAPGAPGGRGADKPAWRRSCQEYAGAPVEVTYRDASGGASVTYRTNGDVQRLRERTAEVARLHRQARLTTREVHDLYHIPHTAYVQDVAHGSELVLLPKQADPDVLDQLRRNVQQEVWIMQKRGCGRGQEAL